MEKVNQPKGGVSTKYIVLFFLLCSFPIMRIMVSDQFATTIQRTDVNMDSKMILQLRDVFKTVSGTSEWKAYLSGCGCNAEFYLIVRGDGKRTYGEVLSDSSGQSTFLPVPKIPIFSLMKTLTISETDVLEIMRVMEKDRKSGTILLINRLGG